MLGVQLNMSKHQRCKQSVEYSGFLFDSFRGVMLCLDEKLALCAELSSSTDPWSMRDLDRIKGRLLHYSAGSSTSAFVSPRCSALWACSRRAPPVSRRGPIPSPRLPLHPMTDPTRCRRASLSSPRRWTTSSCTTGRSGRRCGHRSLPWRTRRSSLARRSCSSAR
jgi:hypothetical protein